MHLTFRRIIISHPKLQHCKPECVWQSTQSTLTAAANHLKSTTTTADSCSVRSHCARVRSHRPVPGANNLRHQQPPPSNIIAIIIHYGMIVCRAAAHHRTEPFIHSTHPCVRTRTRTRGTQKDPPHTHTQHTREHRLRHHAASCDVSVPRSVRTDTQTHTHTYTPITTTLTSCTKQKCRRPPLVSAQSVTPSSLSLRRETRACNVRSPHSAQKKKFANSASLC